MDLLSKRILPFVLVLLGGRSLAQTERAVPTYAGDEDSAIDPDAKGEPVTGTATQAAADENDEELALTQEELRDEMRYGIAIGSGVSVPWQMYGVSFTYKIAPQWMFSASLGAGRFASQGTSKGRDYEIKVNTQSLVAGARWYPMARAPLFVEPLLGFGLWDGRMKPAGNDEADSSETSRLTAGISASGLVFGGNFGVVWAWSNHVFIEYSIERIGLAMLLRKTITDATDDSKVTVEKGIERPQSWGFANMRVGWNF